MEINELIFKHNLNKKENEELNRLLIKVFKLFNHYLNSNHYIYWFVGCSRPGSSSSGLKSFLSQYPEWKNEKRFRLNFTIEEV